MTDNKIVNHVVLSGVDDVSLTGLLSSACAEGVFANFPRASIHTCRFVCQAFALAMPLHVDLAVDGTSSSEFTVRDARSVRHLSTHSDDTRESVHFGQML